MQFFSPQPLIRARVAHVRCLQPLGWANHCLALALQLVISVVVLCRKQLSTFPFMTVNVFLRKVTGIVCLINSRSGCFGHGCCYLAHALPVLRHIISKIPMTLMVILEYRWTNWVWTTRALTSSLSPLIKKGPLRLWYSQQQHCIHH